jgi:hypothetical protein
MQNEGVKKGMAQSNFVRWANWAREMWQRDAGRKLSFDAAHCDCGKSDIYSTFYIERQDIKGNQIFTIDFLQWLTARHNSEH